MKTWQIILFFLSFSLLIAISITGIAIAYSNPEVIALFEKAAEYGLRGLEAYFRFLIELFKEAIKALK
jgi:hypothetical protein